MKKLILIALLTTLGLNYYFTKASDDIIINSEISVQNIAFALIEEFDCYTTMFYAENYRTLECNTPCCYRQEYSPYISGGKCSGKFSNC